MYPTFDAFAMPVIRIDPSPSSLSSSLSSLLALRAPPRRLPSKVLDLLQCASQPDHAISYHPRVQPQRLLDCVLHPRRAVEAHDEVMARVMLLLMHPQRLRQEECAPVGETPNDALPADDDVACRPCDSVSWSVDAHACLVVDGESVLFDLGELAGPHLRA
ncbi:hypothetical protein MRB53_039408 [Persea americana]|nr:hypothetical protein MRB53_039408 [Persea americana]